MDAMTDGMTGEAALAVGLETIGRKDIAEVGGKNASLGEMIGALASSGIMVPGGFATTADAYWQFVEANGLRDVMIAELGDLDGGKIALADAGRAIRDAFIRGDWPEEARAALGTGAGCFFDALIVSRLFRSASIKLTTLGGASGSGVTTSRPAILASMTSRRPSWYSSR